MKQKLTMRECARSGKGPDLRNWDTVEYLVQHLPEGEEARIARFDNRWQVRRVRSGVASGWGGDYATAEDALAALQISAFPERRRSYKSDQ